MMLRNQTSRRLASSSVTTMCRRQQQQQPITSLTNTNTINPLIRKRVLNTSAGPPKNCRNISSTSSNSKSAQALSSKSAQALNPLRTTTISTTTATATTANESKSILPLAFVLQDSTKAVLPILGNLSYLALASGFLMTDMLDLRLLLVSGYTGLVAFHTLHERPLRIPLRWSALFVAVNAVAAGWLIMDRCAPTLTSEIHPDGEALYEEHFSNILTRGQFHQLLELATRQRMVEGTLLTRERVPCDSMYFIVQGQAHVYHGKSSNAMEDADHATNNNTSNNSSMTTTAASDVMESSQNIATIEQGGFVNDVAFTQGAHEGAYGSVVASQDSDVLVWDTATLRDHMASRPDMERNMKYCMSDHLVKSLLRQREAAHKRQQQLRLQQS